MINPNDYQDPDTLGLLFVGGCGEFGMNLTCYLYQKRLYLVDCGLAFADDHELGIEAHIPEIDELITAFGGIRAYIITHGHEDHIGALPHFLSKWPAKVYCTPWSSKLLADKMARRGRPVLTESSLQVMRAGGQCSIDQMQIDWVGVPHSIPDCCSLIIKTAAGQLFHSGDFKLAHHPDYEAPFDPTPIKESAKQGFLATIIDSTNAPSSGSCPSEETVQEGLEQTIKTAEGAVVFATFSSNLWRLKTVLQAASTLGRHVHIAGAGVSKTLEIATELGLFSGDTRLFIDAEQLKKTPRNKVLVLATGSQGEHRSALKRILAEEYAAFRFKAGDRLVLSSRTIPGNEKSVFKMISTCHKLGVEVISSRENPAIHVSGHAYAGDIQQILEYTNPRYHIPVHGTFTQMEANTRLGDPSATIVRVENGSLIRFQNGKITDQKLYDLNLRYIDSWSNQALDYETLRSRLKIGDSGLCLVSGYYDSASGLVKKLDLECIGLNLPDPSPQRTWLEKQPKDLATWITNFLKQQSRNHEVLCEELRRHIRRQLAALFVKKPVVIVKLFAEGQ